MSKNNLKKVLEKEGIRISELAKVANLSVGTIGSVTNSKRQCSAVTQMKIVKAIENISHKKIEMSDIFSVQSVELTLNISEKDFSSDDEEKLLTKIKKVLKYHEIEIIKKKKGSIKLLFEFTEQQYELLLKEIKKGNFKSFSLTDAKISRLAFVIMKFGDEILDSAYEGVIKPVFSEFGYTCFRVDEIQNSGLISDQILESIRKSEVVLSDLSGERPNCYYESGYAHALGKEIILSIKNGEKVHFDLSGHRFLMWKTEADFRRQLRERIKSICQKRI
jgi:hypothetical protein